MKLRRVFIQKFKLYNMTLEMQNCILVSSIISVGVYDS